MSERYTAVFTSPGSDDFRKRAEVCCVENNLRLGDDNRVYNAYGVAVARYLGPGLAGNIRFENLRLETDWDKAKIFNGGK